MDPDEQTRLYVEMWKQTVEVQKHFNDIEIRIRGLALTVLTFALGAAAVAIKDGTFVLLFHHRVHLSALILLIGSILWLTFYFVDQVWYHRLLIGSVEHGAALEEEIGKVLPAAGLTKQISTSSPYEFKIGLFKWKLKTWQIHSSMKLRIYYWLVTLLLVVFAVAAQTATDKVAASGPSPTPTRSAGATPNRGSSPSH